MATFRPIHGVIAVAVLMAGYLAVDALAGGSTRFERVGAGADGRVLLEVADLAPLQARFFRFLNPANQEVKFFVARDESGALQVAFDASENDFKRKRGFRVEGSWVVNNKCETSIRLAEVNRHPSGCAPVPLAFREEAGKLVLAERDLLEGWRYFR